MASETASRRGGVGARIVGGILAAVGVVVGVVAAAFIPQPPWGIAAAGALAAASVSVAAGLLLLRRADSERRPDAGAPSWSAKRERRAMRVYGAFLLAAGAAMAVGLLLRDPADGAEPIRSSISLAFFSACGATLLALGLAPVRDAVASSTRPAGDPTTDAAGWVRLGADRRADLRSVWRSIVGYQLLQVPILVVSTTPLLLQLGPWSATIAIGVAVVAILVMSIVIRRRMRAPWVAPDGSALRLGTTQVRAAEITTASLSASPLAPDATERDLLLTIGVPHRLRATVQLRGRGRLVLTDAETTLLLELLERSSIELPRDQHDPTGRFSKSLYPDHLTKAEAEAVVAVPPGDGEPLPARAA